MIGKRLVWVGLVCLAVAVALGVAVSSNGGGTGPSLVQATVAAVTPARGHAGVMRRSESLSLRILSSYTSRRIENEYVPATARGTYVIMDVSASNDTSHAVALRPAGVTLDLGGVEHPLDAAALSALELAGHKALATTSLGPDETTAGWVVFDVPPHAVGATASLRVDLGSHAP